MMTTQQRRPGAYDDVTNTPGTDNGLMAFWHEVKLYPRQIARRQIAFLPPAADCFQ